jgi:hypothetical protein
MAANAKPALEKIRRISKTKTSAIQSNTSKFYKIPSRAMCRFVASSLDLFSKAPKESVDGARCLEKACVPRSAASKFGYNASLGSNDPAQILDGPVQYVRTGLLHEGKRIRTNGHEC